MKAVLIEKEVEALIKRGLYKNKESLYDEALRVLFIYRPELRIESAIELYSSREISLARASEIAAIDIESFKEELKRRRVKIEIHPPHKEVIEKGVSAILDK